MRDPDYGDEAYDLRRDPRELENLLAHKGVEEPPEVAQLRRRVDQCHYIGFLEKTWFPNGHYLFRINWFLPGHELASPTVVTQS